MHRDPWVTSRQVTARGVSLGHPGKAVICLVTPKQTLHGGPFLLCPLLLQEPPSEERQPPCSCLGALERPKASCVPGKEAVQHPRCSAPSQVLGCSPRRSPLTP